MFGRHRESLRELIHSQHEESRRREEKWERYLEKRDEEVQVFVEEVQAHKAELHGLREKAEAREEETREFNREILLRNEKVYTSLIAEMEEGRMQIRANTKAVLSVLDRLNGSDGLAA
ncbi:MAG TPA: hypothetical protein VGC63_10680 [Solirubrobacterales bacterium]|jgi:hypothetical protein